SSARKLFRSRKRSLPLASAAVIMEIPETGGSRGAVYTACGADSSAFWDPRGLVRAKGTGLSAWFGPVPSRRGWVESGFTRRARRLRGGTRRNGERATSAENAV